MNEVFTNPAVVGLMVAIPPVALAILAFRTSGRAAESAEKKDATDAIADAWARIDILQKSNDELRARIAELGPLKWELAGCVRRVERLEKFIQAQGWQVPE